MKTNHFKLTDSSFSLSTLCKKKHDFFHEKKYIFKNLNVRLFFYVSLCQLVFPFKVHTKIYNA